ncbi:MAG: GH25 family lysozyme [Beijerinckiaceae bacterium]
MPRNFVWPADALTHPGWTFGVDVSHHNGPVVWSMLQRQGVGFAYLKATQGTLFFDRSFAAHWRTLSELGGEKPILKGAYHFLSADVDAELQAEHFLRIVNAAGGLHAGDLPPCLDVEWDPRTINGAEIDAWDKYSAQQIVERIETWLRVVEKATGRRPIVYTNAIWWLSKTASSRALVDYPLWIADYAIEDLRNDEPRSLPGYRSPIWQFTDSGVMSEGGAIGRLDVSVFKGGRDDLVRTFAIRP